jgi:hypothetical protein
MNAADCAAPLAPPRTPLSPDRARPRDLVTAALCALPILLLAASADAQSPLVDRPLPATVKTVSTSRPVALIDIGRSAGLTAGDRAVFLADGDTSGLPEVLAGGEVIYLEGDQAGIAWTPPERRLPSGASVIVIAGQWTRRLGGSAAGEIYRQARVDSGIPGTDNVWLDAGSDAGWRVGDKLLVWREATPATWGEVVLAAPAAALARVREGASLSAPQRGDRAEQLGGVRPGYGLRTAVIAVQDAGETCMARLAGDEALGVAVGDRIDFFRSGRYVGFGTVTLVAPSLWAEVAEAMSREAPQVGDCAYVRAGRDAVTPARSGYVFRVDADYVLVTLGEADGVAAGDRLTLLGPDGAKLQLSVSSVYPDHCGAEIVAGGPAIEPAQRAWRRVVRADEETASLPWVEAVRHPVADWLFEVRGSGNSLTVGELVAPRAEPGAVAVVVVARGTRAWAVRVDRLRYGGVE